MKICILTPRFPFPENGGDVLRINNIARYLKSKGHQLVLVSYCTDNIKQKQLDSKEQLYDKIYCVKHNKLIALINTVFALLFNKPMMIGYYFSFKYLSIFREVIYTEQPDLYISHLIRMVPYLNICRLQNKSIIEMTDDLAKTYSLVDIAKLSLKKIAYKIERKRIEKYTAKTLNMYKKCVFVSEADRESLNHHKSVYVHANGIRCLPNIQDEYNKNKIVFVGNMRTLQNQDAVYFFVNDIFPIIKDSIPQATFHIIGADPPAHIQKIADNKNIFVSGFVNSVEDEIKDAAVSVAPVRIAAGIQNKVLISMACGIPVVLTPLISTGIPELISNRNCIIANEENGFANAVISLMQNDDTRHEIGHAGYDMTMKEYSWNNKLSSYETMS